MLRGHLFAFCWLAACTAGAAWAQEEEPAEPQEVRPTEPFSREILLARAAELAGRPHALPERPEVENAAQLTYEQYRSIRFDPNAAIWSGQNRTFVVDLLYPGFIYGEPVNINLVVGGTARRVYPASSCDCYCTERARCRAHPQGNPQSPDRGQGWPGRGLTGCSA